ncbi:MAG: hypothetical protein HQL35_12425 [Alphaproteobacteria bacterium]|nr:hypothetical protein [Alphaproteobacteria bacterium]
MRVTSHARDMVQSGVLGVLANAFDLSLLYITDGREEVPLDTFGTAYTWPHKGRAGTGLLGRIRDWRRDQINNIAYALNQISRRRGSEQDDYLITRTTTHWPWKIVHFVSFVARCHLETPVAWLFRTWLRMTYVPMIPDGEDRPDVMLVMNNPFNIDGHIDDVLRDARAKGIPVFAQQLNWDNLADRNFLEDPDYVGVFGEQAFLFCRLIHGYSGSRVFLTGSPRFEFLRRDLPDRVEARRRLGLPEQGRILMYCSGGRTFDDAGVLRDINRAIVEGRLPTDVHVYFKGHTGRVTQQVTGDETSALEEDDVLSHVTEWEPETPDTPATLDLYPYLYAACDALVSPFSTMLLEGELCGRPALCLAYNDPDHPSNEFGWDWERTSYRLHLSPLRHSDAVVICESREDLIRDCGRVLALLDRPCVAEAAKKNAEIAVTTGLDSCAERIISAVRRCYTGEGADGSHIMDPGFRDG